MAKKSPLSNIMKADLKAWRVEKSKLPRLIAEEAVNEFRLNFRRQGFKDATVKKWKKRKSKKDTGRGILVGKGSGKKLSRSIRQLQVSKRQIIIGSTVHYAGVHNYGLRAGRGRGFKMPQRKFVGNSKSLDKKIRKLIIKRIDRAFEK